MRTSEVKLRNTVGLMAREWSAQIQTTGQLTPEYMQISLRRAAARGLPVVLAVQESTLQRMDAMLIGDE